MSMVATDTIDNIALPCDEQKAITEVGAILNKMVMCKGTRRFTEDELLEFLENNADYLARLSTNPNPDEALGMFYRAEPTLRKFNFLGKHPGGTYVWKHEHHPVAETETN